MESEAGGINELTQTTRERQARRRPSAEDIAWVGLWPASLALIVCLLWLAPPLSELVPAPNYPYFPVWNPIIKPEPLETTRFLLAVVMPFALAAAVLLGSARPANRRFDPAAIVMQVAGIGLIIWGVVEQVDGPYPPFVPDAPHYFKTLLLSVPVLASGAAIGVALTFLALTGKRPFDQFKPHTSVVPAWRRSEFAAALIITALWLLPAVTTDASVANGGLIPAQHIPLQADDYFAVVNGRTPLVDYVAQYSQLLPLAIAPLLRLFDLSLTSFSVFMTLLSLTALLAIFGAFYEVTRRPLAAFALYIPFLAISLFPWTDHGPYREFNGNYYGFFPSRYLGPFVVVWLCALAVRRRRLPTWLLFFVAGLAALNNAEFGATCTVALFAGLMFGSDCSVRLMSTIRTLLLQAAIGLVAALGLVGAVILVRTGELPDFALLSYYSRLFGRQAFGLEPMPALGLHIGIYFTFAAAVVTAAVRYVQGQRNSPLTAMLAFAGVFGLLAGSYFAGRSLPWQLMLLFPIWALAGALLAMTTAEYLRSARGSSSLRRLLLPSLLVMSGFGVMIAAIGTFPPPWTQLERISQSGRPANDLPGMQRFIRDRTVPGEPVLIFGTAIDHRVAELASVENLSPWNSVLSLFSPREVRFALDALEDAGGSKVFLRQFGSEGGLIGDQGPVTRLLRAKGFREVAENQNGRLSVFQLR